MDNCNGTLGTEDQKNKFLSLLDKYKNNTSELINVLQQTQMIYGFLPKHIVKMISDSLNVSLSEVYGVITFYTQFNLTPKAEYTANVCLGTACFIGGSELILNKLCEKLNLKPGELSSDGKWMISTCRCLGCCGLTPVLKINDKIYGKVKPEQVDDILKEYGIN